MCLEITAYLILNKKLEFLSLICKQLDKTLDNTRLMARNVFVHTNKTKKVFLFSDVCSAETALAARLSY